MNTEIKVRGYHLDGYQHVNNARFLEFLEEARWSYMEQNPGFRDWPKGVSFFVVNININYRKPAAFGDVLSISTRLCDIRKKSATIHQDITNKGTGIVVADADVVFVLVDEKTQKTIPLTGGMYTVLENIAGFHGID
ncbi:MAG: YbgC/FadM family acyl-CoA thioesterase [Desulfobacteraceae bacterium]|nr:YbgC/FadM family acyl-CoA thioesterase [Desulfobacteraceae bacterium]